VADTLLRCGGPSSKRAGRRCPPGRLEVLGRAGPVGGSPHPPVSMPARSTMRGQKAAAQPALRASLETSSSAVLAPGRVAWTTAACPRSGDSCAIAGVCGSCVAPVLASKRSSEVVRLLPKRERGPGGANAASQALVVKAPLHGALPDDVRPPSTGARCLLVLCHRLIAVPVADDHRRRFSRRAVASGLGSRFEGRFTADAPANSHRPPRVALPPHTFRCCCPAANMHKAV